MSITFGRLLTINISPIVALVAIVSAVFIAVKRLDRWYVPPRPKMPPEFLEDYYDEPSLDDYDTPPVV